MINVTVGCGTSWHGKRVFITSGTDFDYDQFNFNYTLNIMLFCIVARKLVDQEVHGNIRYVEMGNKGLSVR